MEERRIEDELERLGLGPQDRGRYWLIHCPTHEDRNKSAVCFKDGWVHCYAGCPRVHINKLCGNRHIVDYTTIEEHQSRAVAGKPNDFTDFWLQFNPIPNDVSVKGVPASELNKRGWRIFPGGWGMRPGLFIPYFSTGRDKVVYFQIRHDEGERRFTFAKGASPLVYGLEQLSKMKDYLVFTEGSRDSVILGMAGVPAVALPSASSTAHLKKMEQYAEEHGLFLVCAGDKDEAGDKLISNLSGPYIDARTPVGKDIGDLFQEQGLEGVKKYYETYATM